MEPQDTPSETVHPPRWSLDSIYPGYKSREYKQALLKLAEKLKESEEVFSPAALEGLNPGDWLEKAVETANSLRGTFENLYAYAYARYSTATRDPEALKELGELEKAELKLKQQEIAFRNTLKLVESSIDSLLDSNESLSNYRLFIRESLTLQSRQLSPAEEDLAADLNRSGGEAWSRLQSTLGATLSSVWNPETGETRTVTQLRTMAFDADRDVRRKAYTMETAAWKSAEVAVSAALNGVKGFSHTLNSRRGYTSTLDRALEQSRISRKTLDALIGAMEESLPAFRKYLKAKADILGLPVLAWYDLFAPLPVQNSKQQRSVGFREAADFIISNFATFSDELAAYASEAVSRQWIDALPREGKVGGAYCISFPESGESRILSNFSGNLRDISTLAHELGHGYHHHVVRDLPPLHQDYPMTLAETASIFSETLVAEKALEDMDEASGLLLMESSLQDSTQVIVDILSRFYFESELMQRRADHELSPEELCSMMLDAQKKTYGEGLDPEQLHPYMWAVKGHYYRPELAFYNFPYAFGLLFGLALYGEYRRNSSGFPQKYRTILKDTGRLNAVELTKEAGFDIEDINFWRSGLSVIGGRIETFVRAASALK